MALCLALAVSALLGAPAPPACRRPRRSRCLLRVPLATVTGRLRQRPGLRQTFPAPAAEPTALPEPVSTGMHPA